MIPAPIPKSPHSERMSEAHRRQERARDLIAIERGAQKPWPLPEDKITIAVNPPKDPAEREAYIRACAEILREHRKDINKLRERVEKLEKRA